MTNIDYTYWGPGQPYCESHTWNNNHTMHGRNKSMHGNYGNKPYGGGKNGNYDNKPYGGDRNGKDGSSKPYGGSNNDAHHSNKSRNYKWPKFGLVLHHDELIGNATWKVKRSNEHAKIICEIEPEMIEGWHIRKWEMLNDKMLQKYDELSKYSHQWDDRKRDKLVEKKNHWDTWWRAFETGRHQHMLDMMEQFRQNMGQQYEHDYHGNKESGDESSQPETDTDT